MTEEMLKAYIVINELGDALYNDCNQGEVVDFSELYQAKDEAVSMLLTRLHDTLGHDFGDTLTYYQVYDCMPDSKEELDEFCRACK